MEQRAIVSRDDRIGARPARSAAGKDAAGQVFRTCLKDRRGVAELSAVYMVPDLTPKGRNAAGRPHNLTARVRPRMNTVMPKPRPLVADEAEMGGMA